MAAWVVLVACLVVGPQSSLARQVPPSGGDLRVESRLEIETAAGRVASVLLRLVNEGPRDRTVRLSPELPDGWSLLIPLSSVRVEAGGAATQLVSIQIPGNALSGDWTVAFTPVAEDPADAQAGAPSHSLTVRVAAEAAISVAFIDAPERIRAGGVWEGTFAVENTGNTAILVSASATSTLSYGVSVSAPSFPLAPGERKRLDVEVRSRDDLVNEVTHVTSVQVQVAGTERVARASASTTIVPVRRSRPVEREGMLPLYLTTRGAWDGGSTHGQIELALPEAPVGRAVVSALVRVPDVRSSSTVGERDVFSASIQGPRLGVRLGDAAYTTTDLLDNSSIGTGAEVTWSTLRWDTGVFAARGRHVFPVADRAGGFLHFRPMSRVTLEANVLSRRQFEEGDALSLALDWRPVDGTTIRAEAASGSYDAGRDQAAQVSALGSVGRSTFSLRAEKAGANFLGGIQNTERVQGGFSFTSAGWFRAQFQGQMQRRFFDVGSPDPAVLSTSSVRGGVGGTWSTDGRQFRAMVYGQQQARQFTASGLDRTERRGELQLGYNQRRAGATATIQAGRAEDLALEMDPFWTAYGSAFRGWGPWTLSVTTSVSSGPTFYSPITRSRTSLGSSLSYDRGAATRFSTSLHVSRERSGIEQQFLMADAWVERDLWAGHQLEVRGRYTRTQFGQVVQNGVVQVAYRVPLNVPAPWSHTASRRELNVYVFDAESGEPLEGVALTVAESTVRTDADGRTVLALPAGEASWILLDRQTIGLERTPVMEFPLRVDAAMFETGVLDVAVVRSARLTVPVLLPADARAGQDAALGGRLSQEDLSGMVVEAASSERRVRRVTDRTGVAVFSELVPGPWSVRVVASTLPDGYVTRPDTLAITLEPGGRSESALQLQPRRRAIRFVETGTPISLVRPGADGEAEEDAGADVGRTHVVVAGESLSTLAERYYGDRLQWQRIWEANRQVVPAPDFLRVGQVLRIPELP
ncbi:MAG: LysM peptidoglycan-binding domain-containing protein [Rhodothermales bacterium]